MCLLAGFRLDPSSQRLGVILLSGELVSLQGQRFSLDEFTWQGWTGSWPAVGKQSMFYSCSSHLAVTFLGLTPTQSDVHETEFSSLDRREVYHWPELCSKTQSISPCILFLWTAGWKEVSCSERVSWHRDVSQQWTLALPLCFLLKNVAGLESHKGWVEIRSISSDKSATNSFSPFIQAIQSNVCIFKMINLSIRTKTGRYFFFKSCRITKENATSQVLCLMRTYVDNF